LLAGVGDLAFGRFPKDDVCGRRTGPSIPARVHPSEINGRRQFRALAAGGLPSEIGLLH